jgi:uncharacterized protein (DUF4213/DUF364 family)
LASFKLELKFHSAVAPLSNANNQATTVAEVEEATTGVAANTLSNSNAEPTAPATDAPIISQSSIGNSILTTALDTSSAAIASITSTTTTLSPTTVINSKARWQGKV